MGIAVEAAMVEAMDAAMVEAMDAAMVEAMAGVAIPIIIPIIVVASTVLVLAYGSDYSLIA